MRARNIKQGFFKNEVLAACGGPTWKPWCRLLFAGLPGMADRLGRLEDRPKRIAAELFPYDDEVDAVIVGQLLDSLSIDGFIHRYSIDGERFIQIVNFTRHQKPHPNETPSVIPPEPDHSIIVGSVGVPRLEATEYQGKTPLGLIPESMPSESMPSESMPSESGEARLERAALPDYGPDDLMADWNEIVGELLPTATELTEKRRRQAKTRLHEHPERCHWQRVIGRIMQSNFCRGENERTWVATFDWLLQPDTQTKVLEGKYDNRAATQASPKSKTSGNLDNAKRALANMTKPELGMVKS